MRNSAFVFACAFLVVILFSHHAWAGKYLQKVLLPDSTFTEDKNFGNSVSISSDGKFALVGTSRDQAVYVFEKKSDSWTQTAKLEVGSTSYFDSVSISSNGEYALIGGYDNNLSTGTVYVFTKPANGWRNCSIGYATLAASNGAGSEYFGCSVSISSTGAYVLIGDPGDGAAYVFEISGGGWTQTAKLTASDGQNNDEFGDSVSLSSDGRYALVGAPGKNVTVGGSTYSDAGAVYVFAKGDSWGSRTQETRLTASDGQEGDSFGNSVSLSGDGYYALVGAVEDAVGGNSYQGSAYVFAMPGNGWKYWDGTYTAKITAPDGQENDSFGSSVSFSSDGNYALIGAYADTVNSSYQGSAYVYAMPGNGWKYWDGTCKAMLTASDGGAFDSFGISASLSGDGSSALVGADMANSGQGAAYVFTWIDSVATASASAVSLDPSGFSSALFIAMFFLFSAKKIRPTSQN